MKVLVVYYSLTGNTRWYLEQLRKERNIDLLEIKPKEEIESKGLKSYFQGGSQSFKKAMPELDSYEFNPKGYEWIIFASPVWAFTFVAPIRSFIKKENITGKKVSFFITHQGGPGNTGKHFKEILTDNEFFQGLDVNIKKDSEKNLIQLKNWLDQLLETQ